MELDEKKLLKEYINENGFFLHSDVKKLHRNDLKDISTNPHLGEGKKKKRVIKTSALLPEGDNILIFQGLTSQNFPPGEKSRNGYKILVDGWDFENYIDNPQILLQHNSDKPVGKALEIMPHENGVDILYFVDLNWMDEVDAARMEGGAFSALSTGHITHEIGIEDNKTGELLSEAEFIEKHGREELLNILFFGSEDFTLVITKAESLENSPVTLPSNPKALTMQNSLQKFFQNTMTKRIKNEGENPEGEETPETPASPEGEGSEKPEGEKPEGEGEVEGEGEEKPEGSEGESPEGAEGGEEGETEPEGTAEDKIKYHESKIKKLKEAPQSPQTNETKVLTAIGLMTNALFEMQKKLDGYSDALKNVPVKQGLRISSQFGGEEEGKEENTPAKPKGFMELLRNLASKTDKV